MRTASTAIGLLAICVTIFSGCELSSNFVSVEPPTGTIKFSSDVLPVLERKCGSCHSSSVRPAPAAGLSLNSWDLILQGSTHGEVVIPFAADHSLLVRLTSEHMGRTHPFELGGDTLSTEELKIIREWIDAGARSDGGDVPFASASRLLYVCNQDDATISIIDMDRNVVARLVDLRDYGFAGSAKPHHVAVESDGSAWYVSLIGANTVAKFSRDDQLLSRFSFETPGLLALDPNSDWLYVGRSLTAPNPPTSIGRVRRTDMTGEEISVAFPRPHAMVLDPQGSFVYSASLGANQIIAIETAGEEVTFAAINGPLQSIVQHAVSPDGALLASTAQLTSRIIFFDLADPAQPAEDWSVGTNAAPWHPTFSPDGRWLYVGNKDANTVSVVSVSGRRVEAIVTGDGLSQPHGAYVSSDGQTLYVSNRNADGSYVPRYELGDNANSGTVTVIDTASLEIVKVLEVGRFAAGMNARATR